MLHTKVVDGTGFRALTADELAAVGGGYFYEDPIPGSTGSQDSLSDQIYQQHIALLSQWGLAPDGEYHGEGEMIVVTASPEDYDGNVFGSFYAVLSDDGGYVQYEKHYDTFLDQLLGNYTWIPVSWGTWAVSFSSGGTEVGTSFTISSPNRTYEFTPQGSL